MSNNQDFNIFIDQDGEFVPCTMPREQDIIEVLMDDGSIQQALYDRDISDWGDWDFVQVIDGVVTETSIADRVRGWRPLEDATTREIITEFDEFMDCLR